MCLAVPGRLIEVRDPGDLAATGRIDFGGVVREASLAFVPEARTGDFVLVHAGVAIAVVDEAEARRVLDTLGAATPVPEGSA